MKFEELEEKECQLIKAKNDLQEKLYQTEQLKKQLESQSSILESTKMEKLRLSEKLHKHLEEIEFVTKENDDLKRTEEALKMERDQLRECLRETEAEVSCSCPVLASECVVSLEQQAPLPNKC